ncbi:hypothetical protein T492DRAFT_955535 [Pavlovales sp. CCMP2436]|nr:hypothetical protein T492DRAFT_955535 [Pavlovales sp. CCMP2436]|mmetsp:Transcript_19713/g.50087  ORF Transcript_19713/g.50087 Transcript_19713/m.50087 type:complete len:196 (-) Transcript_19713:280-867(-)
MQAREEEGTSLQYGGETDRDRQCEHPQVAFFHLFFRTAAILTYVFCTWVSSSFVLSFIITVLLLAFDFWTVKNVSGRLLVGLRWWNEILPDGSSEWRFECADMSHRRTNALDSTVFWVGLLVPPVLWVLFALGALLRLNFEWLLIVAVALGLNGANVIGYLRCRKDNVANLKSMVTNAGMSAGMGSLMRNLPFSI